MTWLSAIAAALSILQAVTQYLRDRKLIDDATAAAMLNGFKESSDAINRAQKARALVRADAARDPASVLRDDDGFRRRDDGG